jgi:hypothetical protein
MKLPPLSVLRCWFCSPIGRTGTDQPIHEGVRVAPRSVRGALAASLLGSADGSDSRRIIALSATSSHLTIPEAGSLILR